MGLRWRSSTECCPAALRDRGDGPKADDLLDTFNEVFPTPLWGCPRHERARLGGLNVLPADVGDGPGWLVVFACPKG